MRPLTLDVSALSDSEYTLYTSILELFCDTDEELRGEKETESAYYERLSFSVRQVRAWVRSKYMCISTKSIDAIFRFFSPNLKSSDILTAGQLFAVLRLVLHAENGEEVDRHLVFVQVTPRKNTPAPSATLSLTPPLLPPRLRTLSRPPSLQSLPTPTLPSTRSRSGSTSSSMSLDSSPGKPTIIIHRLKATPPPIDGTPNRPDISVTTTSTITRETVSPDDNKESHALDDRYRAMYPRDGSLTRDLPVTSSTTSTGIRMPIPTSGYKIIVPDSSPEFKEEEEDLENPFKDSPESWSSPRAITPSSSQQRKRNADTQDDSDLEFAVFKRVRRNTTQWVEMQRPLNKEEAQACMREMRYSQSLDGSLN